MTLLNCEQVKKKGIVWTSSGVRTSPTTGARQTTYDATIGEIYDPDGNMVQRNTYQLAPRGIAWVVSKEHFNLPVDVTGITTLRTTWTKKGILTLTVGIVDPGYNGPLSTAVINFGKTDFPLTKGDTFFRTAFFENQPSSQTSRVTFSRNKYVKEEVVDQLPRFSETFLTMDTLADEIAKKIFSFPRWAFKLTCWALVTTLVLFAFSFLMDISKNVSLKDKKIEMLEKRVKDLEVNQ